MSERYYARSATGSAGAMLASHREAQNLSVEDVSRHLKLSPAQVEALEAGAYERLPGRVFVRGFLRNYAKLMGIDPQPLLRAIDAEMPEPVRVEEPPPVKEVEMPLEQRSRWSTYAGIALFAVAALAIYEFGFNDTRERDPDANAETAGPAESKGGGIRTEQAAAPTASNSAAIPAAQSGMRTAMSQQQKGAGTATAAAPGQPGAAASAAAQNDDSPRVARAGERQLRFRFDQESWVEVRDRKERVIFSKLNRPGSEERVTGTPPLRLVIGNARNVQLTSDDRAVDLTPHIDVSVARLTLE
jgi:cytoskeleton protein RodZ